MQTQADSQKNTRQPTDPNVQVSQTSASLNRVLVPTNVEGAKSTAKLDSKSNNVQVIQASPNSSIAGSQIEFPPGAIAIETEITVQPGSQVATAQTIQSLAIDTQVLSKSTPMAISSTVAIDTETPFSVSLPLPNTTSLLDQATAEGQLFLGSNNAIDPLNNLVVFFNITIAAENRAIQGLIPRSDIEIVNGYARFFTRHFGTFQTAILSKRIDTQVQAPAAPLPPPPTNAIAETPAPRRYFIKGPRSVGATPGQLIQTWVPTMTPIRTTTGQGTLMSGVSSYPEP